MILPTSILDIIEEANDYYFPTLTNVYFEGIEGDYYLCNSFSDTGIFVVYAKSQLASGGISSLCH